MPDLFDFFKEQESKLHERPPEQVWNQLQSRLEKRRKRRQGVRFLQLTVVALILLLLLLVAVAVWHYARRDGQGRVYPALEQAEQPPGRGGLTLTPGTPF
jgi:predicted nucleic acid-binding Zn ribbon protein